MPRLVLPARHALALSLVAVAACATNPSTRPPATSAVAAPTAGAFTLLRAGDTLGVERFTRSATRLEAAFAARGTPIFRYVATLAPDASVSRIEVTTTLPGQPEQVSTAMLRGDTAVFWRGTDSSAAVRRPVPRGAVPYINPSPSLMDQIVRRARVIGGESASVPIVIAAAGTAREAAASVSFVGADSAVVTVGGVAVRLRVTPNGMLMGGNAPSQGITIVRSSAGAALP